MDWGRKERKERNIGCILGFSECNRREGREEGREGRKEEGRRKETERGGSCCRVLISYIKQNGNVICNRWDWDLGKVGKI